jgi:hypothetical protein
VYHIKSTIGRCCIKPVVWTSHYFQTNEYQQSLLFIYVWCGCGVEHRCSVFLLMLLSLSVSTPGKLKRISPYFSGWAWVVTKVSLVYTAAEAEPQVQYFFHKTEYFVYILQSGFIKSRWEMSQCTEHCTSVEISIETSSGSCKGSTLER